MSGRYGRPETPNTVTTTTLSRPRVMQRSITITNTTKLLHTISSQEDDTLSMIPDDSSHCVCEATTVPPRLLTDKNINSFSRFLNPTSTKVGASAAVCRSFTKIEGLSMPPVPPAKPATDGRKGKKVSSHQDNVLHLKLLYNRYLQWRFANAKAEESIQAKRRETEGKDISRNELIQKVRQIAGDRLLTAVIKSYKAKVEQYGAHGSPYLGTIDKKGMDIAIIKATRHKVELPKGKHINELDGMLGAIIPTRTWFGVLVLALGVGMLECSGSPPNVSDFLSINSFQDSFFLISLIFTWSNLFWAFKQLQSTSPISHKNHLNRKSFIHSAIAASLSIFHSYSTETKSPLSTDLVETMEERILAMEHKNDFLENFINQTARSLSRRVIQTEAGLIKSF